MTEPARTAFPDLPEALSPQSRGYFPIALVAILGAGISGFAFQQITAWERQRVHAAFQEAARDRVLVIQREIEHTLGVVQDIGSFFDASRWVGRREFREFVGPALKRHASIVALEWVPWVTNAGRAAFEAEARRSFPRFRITEQGADGETLPAQARPGHFPILYVQPYRLNKPALGLDLASNPAVLQALLEARDSGHMVVSPAFAIARGGVEQVGFVARLPVYHKDQSGDKDVGADSEELADVPGETMTLSQRRQLLRGFAAGIFVVREIVDGALENLTPAGINVRFYDVTDGDHGTLLYTHPSRLRKRPKAAQADAEAGSPWQFEGALSVAERKWTAVCTAVPGRFQPDALRGWAVLLGGLAFTALLTVYLSTLVGRAAEVRRLVAERTAQLVQAIEALNSEIAERKRAERELQRLNETLEQRVAKRTAEAERRAEELEQFAYVASHDLKAPLRAIANLAGWIQEDLQTEPGSDTAVQLSLLRDRVGRMHALIEGVLEYSRVGRTEGAVETVDTAEILAETIDSLAPPPGVIIDVAQDMPTLRTDRLQLGQVFANLIGNSVKHRRGDEGHIWISVRDQGSHYEFTVADDGPGIRPEYHDKVFMMFQTLATRDFGSDTGIGLALVRKIVQEHGGLIGLESGEGKGAAFRFTWQKEG